MKTKWIHSRHYRIYPLRMLLPLSVFTSLGLILYNEDVTWNTFTNYYFYLAWGVSWLVTLVVLALVLGVTLYLDYYHPWIKNYNRRTSYQILAGVMAPMVCAFLLIALYFSVYQINIFKTIWIREYMMQIAALLVIINFLFYFIWHRDRNSRVEHYKVWKRRDRKINTDWVHDLACIMSAHRHSYAIKQDGSYTLSPVNIEKCVQLLPPPDYFWVNSSYIVHLPAIAHVFVENTKQVYIVLPKCVEATVFSILDATGHLNGNKHTVRFKNYEGENRLCLKVSQSKFVEFINLWGHYNVFKQ